MEAAIIGSSLIGAAASSNAARRAANVQADAAQRAAEMQLTGTREANALQWAMYQQALQNQAPYMRGGQTAFAALMGGMGLGNLYQPQAGGGQPATTMPVPGRARPLEAGGPNIVPNEAPPGGYAMPVEGGGGAAVAPAVMPGVGGAPTGTFDPGQLPPGLQPRNIGATPEEMAGAAGQYGGRFTERFTGQDIYRDPSYEFRLQEGLRALRAGQAATGLLQTGQGLKDITNYAQGAASQEYGNAYQRFMEQQNQAYNRLAALAGVGQTATGASTAAGTAAGQQIGQNIMGGVGAAGNLLTSGAAARAGGYVGGANALAGSLTGGLQNWMMMQYLNRPSVAYQAPVVTATPTPVMQYNYGGMAQPGVPGP